MPLMLRCDDAEARMMLRCDDAVSRCLGIVASAFTARAVGSGLEKSARCE